jgi:O-methyltransferase/aklanonic acid methyltransferase
VYDRAAVAYGRHAASAFSYFGDLLVRRVGVADGMKVLDVGTGRGAALWPALEAVGPRGHVVGVDLSPEMVRHLADDLAKRSRTNAEARVMDAEHLQCGDHAFDAVLCSQALPFFPGPDRALAEMFRVLRPGGVLGVATKAAFDRRWAWDSRLLAAYPHARVKLVTSPFATAEQLGEALSAAGFVDFDAAVEEIDLTFDDVEEYWDYVWSTGLRASLDRLTADELADYRRECDAHLRRMAGEGGIRQTYQVLLAGARRPPAEGPEWGPRPAAVAGAPA